VCGQRSRAVEQTRATGVVGANLIPGTTGAARSENTYKSIDASPIAMTTGPRAISRSETSEPMEVHVKSQRAMLLPWRNRSGRPYSLGLSAITGNEAIAARMSLVCLGYIVGSLALLILL